jgi:predicted transcriptional regulator
MNKMKDIGLVNAEKRGRKKEYTLTEQGQDIADNLISIYESIGGIEIPQKESESDWNDEKLTN